MGPNRPVPQAITTFGNGFLDAELLSELKSDQTKCYSFYEEILKTVYRIIFLLYAEQRGMLGGAGEHNLYLEEYSLTALRERAASYGKVDGHKDHWIGLKNTFRIIWKGSPALGIYPYNGMLFETSGEEYISRYDCKNEKLLEAIRYLTLTEIEGTARRISYSDINVEEIGAIYESLLDYHLEAFTPCWRILICSSFALATEKARDAITRFGLGRDVKLVLDLTRVESEAGSSKDGDKIEGPPHYSEYRSIQADHQWSPRDYTRGRRCQSLHR